MRNQRAAPAAEAADVLAQLGPPHRRAGAPSGVRPRAAGTIGGPVVLPDVRAWDRPAAPGLVRVEAPEPGLVVDGSAEGLAAASARRSPASPTPPT